MDNYSLSRLLVPLTHASDAVTGSHCRSPHAPPPPIPYSCVSWSRNHLSLTIRINLSHSAFLHTCCELGTDCCIARQSVNATTCSRTQLRPATLTDSSSAAIRSRTSLRPARNKVLAPWNHVHAWLFKSHSFIEQFLRGTRYRWDY